MEYKDRLFEAVKRVRKARANLLKLEQEEADIHTRLEDLVQLQREARDIYSKLEDEMLNLIHNEHED